MRQTGRSIDAMRRLLIALDCALEAWTTTLPPGKFDTNCRVCHLATLALNLMRLMGQNGGSDARMHHEAKRWKLDPVMPSARALPTAGIDAATSGIKAARGSPNP